MVLTRTRKPALTGVLCAAVLATVAFFALRGPDLPYGVAASPAVDVQVAGDEPERSDAETVMRAYVQKLVAKDAKGIEKLARPGNLDTRCVADHWVSKYGEAAELGRVFVRVYAADTPSRTHALLIYDGTQDEQKVRLQKVENVWWINMGRVRGSGVDPCGAPAHD